MDAGRQINHEGGAMKKRLQTKIGRPRGYPFDSMAYGDYYIIPCEKKDSRRISNNVLAIARYYGASDYRISTKFIETGLSVRKIKRDSDADLDIPF